MNILLLCQIFEIGDGAGSERHFFFAKYAVSKGNQVTAITSNVDYKNARVKILGTTGAVKRVAAGVEIFYVYSYANFRGSFIKRFYYYLTYFLASIIQSFKINKSDVIYAVSTPLTVGLLGYVISRLRRIPFVFEVTDVWPDAAVACGVVKNSVLIKLASCLEMFCYRKAVHIVGLTQGICDNIIAKGIDPSKVTLITNGVDFSLFSAIRDESKVIHLRNELSFHDRFIAMYMGAHGAYNSLHTIIEAALHLKYDCRFLFVFVGDGDEKEKLKAQVTLYGISNVVFLPPIPRSDCVELLACADSFLLPNRKGVYFEGNLPNKLFDYMASSRPIIVTGAGETPKIVKKAGCGIVSDAEDSRAMAESLTELVMMPSKERIEMGARGRAYVLEHHDRSLLSQRFLSILDNCTNH